MCRYKIYIGIKVPIQYVSDIHYTYLYFNIRHVDMIKYSSDMIIKYSSVCRWSCYTRRIRRPAARRQSFNQTSH